MDGLADGLLPHYLPALFCDQSIDGLQLADGPQLYIPSSSFFVTDQSINGSIATSGSTTMDHSLAIFLFFFCAIHGLIKQLIVIGGSTAAFSLFLLLFCG